MMVNGKVSILFLLLLFAFSTLLAQRGEKDIQIIDFGADDRPEGRIAYSGLILKTSPVSFLFGHQTFEAEKELNDFISLQAGVGVTFKSLFAAALFDEDTQLELEGLTNRFYFGESEQWVQDITDYYYEFSHRRAKPGYRATVSVRLFFESDGYEGSYLSPALTFSRYNYEVQTVQPTLGDEVVRLENEWAKEYENITDLSVRYGYTTLYPRLALDYFIGLGVRMIKGVREDLGRDVLGRTGSKVRNVDELKLLFEAGIRVGFQL
jgi:hypothetical protein